METGNAVCDFPPGTTEWNKIKHRKICQITQHRRCSPLVRREAVVNLIGAVTTKDGLTLLSGLDEIQDETGWKGSQSGETTLAASGTAPWHCDHRDDEGTEAFVLGWTSQVLVEPLR